MVTVTVPVRRNPSQRKTIAFCGYSKHLLT